MKRIVCRAASIGLLLGLGGCVNLDPQADPTRFYTLAPLTVATAPTVAEVRVDVAPLPAFLQTRRLARREGDHEIVYLEFDRWTGPLDVMVRQRLRESLLLQLGENAGAGALHLTVEFLRFDATASGEAILVADYRLVLDSDLEGARSGRFSDQLSVPVNPDGSEIAPAFGTLLDRLAAAVAETR